jgi:hypothetical protein
MKIWDWLSDYKFGIFNKWWWRDFWYQQISSRICPRNKWLTKQIPRTWQDKDVLLETCVLGALKHYVDEDGEDCFHTVYTSAESEKDFYFEVRKYYELTTIKLVSLQKELDVAWKDVSPRSLTDIKVSTKDDYERIYGKVNRLEKEISDLKTEIMVWVVKNRERLWT